MQTNSLPSLEINAHRGGGISPQLATRCCTCCGTSPDIGGITVEEEDVELLTESLRARIFLGRLLDRELAVEEESLHATDPVEAVLGVLTMEEIL